MQRVSAPGNEQDPATGLATGLTDAGPTDTGGRRLRVAVLIPCFDEEAAIGKVVRDFRAAMPWASVYVYDNNSTDRTMETASAAGAVVRSEPLQGKGNVVRRMFADVDADIYVLVDGDDTYDATAAPAMVRLLLDRQLDMVNASRVSSERGAYRRGHRFGNWLLTGCVAQVFGRHFNDMLSGYRVMSRRFVKSFPALSRGFEIETELTIHALALRMPVAEVPAPYRERPPGSASKLHTIRDGLRILTLIFVLTKEERPMPFFTAAFVLLAALSLALAVPILLEYSRTGLVPRLPTAVLSVGAMLLAFLALTCGFVLDTVTRGRHAMLRLQYLQLAGPAGAGGVAERNPATRAAARRFAAAGRGRTLATPGVGRS